MLDTQKTKNQHQKKSPDQQFFITQNNYCMNLQILNENFKLCKISPLPNQIDSFTRLMVVNHQFQFIGGECYSPIASRLLRIDSSGKQIDEFKMPNSLTLCSPCIQNNQNIIFSGGRQEGCLKTQNNVILFNCITENTAILPNLNCHRESHCSIILKDRLFIIGGQSGTRHRKSIEILDLQEWENQNYKKNSCNYFDIKPTSFKIIDITLFRIVDMSECVWDDVTSSIIIFGGNYSNGVIQRIRYYEKENKSAIEGVENDIDRNKNPDSEQYKQQQEDDYQQYECVDEIDKDYSQFNGPVQKIGQQGNEIIFSNIDAIWNFQFDFKEGQFTSFKMMDLENCSQSHIGLF